MLTVFLQIGLILLFLYKYLSSYILLWTNTLFQSYLVENEHLPMFLKASSNAELRCFKIRSFSSLSKYNLDFKPLFTEEKNQDIKMD